MSGTPNDRSDWHETIRTVVGTLSVLLIAVGLYFTARANRDTNAANLKQQHLAEQGQVTDRFGRAIDLLGSNELDVRVGGVYALERLMHDSPSDEPTIIEVLSAFVRDHTPESVAARSHVITSPCRSAVTLSKRSQPRPSNDAQAALTVLGRLPVLVGSHRAIDLTWADIAGASLPGANLTRVDLRCAGLTQAYLTGASLRYASLRWAYLNRANLSGADLTGAHLPYTDLTRTNFSGADLSGADLSGADLSGADLSGADLSGADLSGADLSGAKWPLSTPVPHGWVRDPGSGLLKQASGGAD